MRKINQFGGWSLLRGSKNKIESRQKIYVFSYPINKSLNINPDDIAPIERINNGIKITGYDSCILSISKFLLL